jgi:hypothetical protein
MKFRVIMLILSVVLNPTSVKFKLKVKLMNYDPILVIFTKRIVFSPHTCSGAHRIAIHQVRITVLITYVLQFLSDYAYAILNMLIIHATKSSRYFGAFDG